MHGSTCGVLTAKMVFWVFIVQKKKYRKNVKTYRGLQNRKLKFLEYSLNSIKNVLGVWFVPEIRRKIG